MLATTVKPRIFPSFKASLSFPPAPSGRHGSPKARLPGDAPLVRLASDKYPLSPGLIEKEIEGPPPPRLLPSRCDPRDVDLSPPPRPSRRTLRFPSRPR